MMTVDSTSTNYTQPQNQLQIVDQDGNETVSLNDTIGDQKITAINGSTVTLENGTTVNLSNGEGYAFVPSDNPQDVPTS